MEHVIIPTHSWVLGCIQNTEKQKQAGMFSSILGPAWQLLSHMTVINLHATALPLFPNKREIMLFRMDFTPHTLFSQLKLLCHQQTFGHSPRIPSESRKESNPLQAKLIFKRPNLYYVLHHCEFDHLGFQAVGRRNSRLLKLLHQWPLTSSKGCCGTEIATCKASTLLFIQLFLGFQNPTPDKGAQP